MHKHIAAFGLLLLVFAVPAEAQNCTAIPNTLTNGTVASATQVMGNFTYLGGCAASIANPSFTGPITAVIPSTQTSGAFYGVNITGAQSVASTGDYYGFNVGPTYTATSGTLVTLEGIRTAPENTGGGALTNLYGIDSEPENTSSGAITDIRGIQANPWNTSSGTVGTIYGVVSTPSSTAAATGTITTMYGVYTETEVNGAATVTTMRPLYANCVNGSTGGTVTNCYELYLDTPTGPGSIGHTYGVYQNYASATNYFAGSVGIGMTPATYLLQVGSSSVSGIVLELQNSSAACTHSPATSTETVSCSSDARLKTDIMDAGAALPSLADMRVREFTVRATGERKTGVIAQEMLNAHPDMVHKGPDGFYKVDEPNPWTLVKAIQELKTANDAQAAELSQLRTQLQKSADTQTSVTEELSAVKNENTALKTGLLAIGRRLDALEGRTSVHSARRHTPALHVASAGNGG